MWKKRLLEAQARIILYPAECEASLGGAQAGLIWLYRSRNHIWLVRPHEVQHTFISDSVIFDYFYEG